MLNTDESREDGSDDATNEVCHNPEVIGNFNGSAKGMLTVPSRSDFDTLEHSSDETWSLGEVVVDQSLKRTRVLQKPSL